MRIFFLMIVIVLSTIPRVSIGTALDWREYSMIEGFSVSLPSKPTIQLIHLPLPDGPTRMYEAHAKKGHSVFVVFAGSLEQKGIYETSAVDAFLDNYVSNMARGMSGGKLVSTRHTTFRDQSAVEYEIHRMMNGLNLTGRGVVFFVDGRHIRLTAWYKVGDADAANDYENFKRSFQLTPLTFQPADVKFRSDRGVTFVPPAGWIQTPALNATEVIRYHNHTRLARVLFADNRAYTCDSFRKELEGYGRVTEVRQVSLANRPFTRILSFEDVPKYKVRLTTVQYCLNSTRGAVVLVGVAEEPVFWRWSEVFEGAAATLQIQ